MRAVRCKLRPPQLNTNHNTARLETTRGFFRAFDKAGRPHPRKRRGIGPGHRRSSGVIAGLRHQPGNWHQPENRHLVGTNPRTGTWRAPTRELAPGGHQPENLHLVGTNPRTGGQRRAGALYKFPEPGGRQPGNWHLAGTNPRTSTLWAPTRELVGSAGLGRYRNSLSPAGANPRTGTLWAPTREMAPGGHQPENWNLASTAGHMCAVFVVNGPSFLRQASEQLMPT